MLLFFTILFISLSPYTWHHEIYTSIFDKDIIEAYKSDCFFNNHNVDFIYIYIHIYIRYIEDIQMFLLNMAFISSSEVENIYIS